MIRGADCFFVVLDHDDGISQVAQPAQSGEEARVIALVQADARLVENVEHAGQAGADLRGEPDALRLAARKRAAFAIEREIPEADFEEELQARFDFAQDLAHDLALLFGQNDSTDETRRLLDRELAESVNV